MHPHGKYRTGDMIAVRSRGPIAWGVRWVTDFRNSYAGEWVANHIAFVIRRSDGEYFVYESLGSRGVVTTPLEDWFARKPDCKVFRPLPHLNSDARRAFAKCATKYEGRKYESWWSFLKIAFDKNKAGDSRLFCSEYYARCAYEACVLDKSPLFISNVEPDELVDLAEAFWERIVLYKPPRAI